MKLIFSSILGHFSLPSTSSATLIHYATMSGAHTGGQANVRREFHFSVEILILRTSVSDPGVVFMYGIYQIWWGVRQAGQGPPLGIHHPELIAVSRA